MKSWRFSEDKRGDLYEGSGAMLVRAKDKQRKARKGVGDMDWWDESPRSSKCEGIISLYLPPEEELGRKHDISFYFHLEYKWKAHISFYFLEKYKEGKYLFISLLI